MDIGVEKNWIIMHKKLLLILYLLIFLSLYVVGMSADEAYPTIEKIVSALPMQETIVYHTNDDDVQQILGAAADTGINLFELIDCMYRYLAPNNKRLEISGARLRSARASFAYGGYPIEQLLPIDTIVSVQLGACFTKTQNPLEMELEAPYSVYVEIATAAYDIKCGFTKLQPLTFLESYGMYIKKWNITKQIRKIHLYEPGFGAVYVNGFFKPKKWAFGAISRVSSQSTTP